MMFSTVDEAAATAFELLDNMQQIGGFDVADEAVC